MLYFCQRTKEKNSFEENEMKGEEKKLLSIFSLLLSDLFIYFYSEILRQEGGLRSKNILKINKIMRYDCSRFLFFASPFCLIQCVHGQSIKNKQPKYS